MFAIRTALTLEKMGDNVAISSLMSISRFVVAT